MRGVAAVSVEFYSVLGKLLAYSAMEPPKYVDASRVKKVLKYEDLIPVIEEALVNFSAGESGGVVQPVRSSVQIGDRGYIVNQLLRILYCCYDEQSESLRGRR